MNTKLGFGLLVAVVMAFSGSAVAAKKGLGNTKGVGGVGTMKQTHVMAKHGAKAKAGQKDIRKGFSKANGANGAIASQKNRGKMVSPKQRIKAGQGALQMKKGQKQVKQVNKKFNAKAKPSPTPKKPLTDKQALKVVGIGL